MQSRKLVFTGFVILAVISILVYVFLWLTTASLSEITPTVFWRITNRRTTHVIAMVIVAIIMALTSISFQTITENRILTPSVIGFDSMFIAAQTTLVFFFGSTNIIFSSAPYNFLFSTVVMVLFSLLMYRIVLRKNKNNLAILLLFGLIISALIRSFTGFLQVIMNPEEFQNITASTSVSIVNINVDLVYYVVPVLVVLIVLFVRKAYHYDVMSLGEDHAIGLGLEYQKDMNKTLIYIAIAMAVATALVGPITFLGLIAVNAVREVLKTYKHIPLMILSCLVAIIFLVLGQAIVQITGYITTVTVLINLVGGVYMIYLIIKENRL